MLGDCDFLWPFTLDSSSSLKSSSTSTEIIVIEQVGMTVTFPADVFMPPDTMCGGTYSQDFDVGGASGFTTTPTPAYSGPITGTNTN